VVRKFIEIVTVAPFWHSVIYCSSPVHGKYVTRQLVTDKPITTLFDQPITTLFDQPITTLFDPPITTLF